MTHRNLVDRALEAVSNVFSDTSVGPEMTRDDLRGLIDEIEIMIEAIEDDIKRDMQ